jgi:hypothetical protein
MVGKKGEGKRKIKVETYATNKEKKNGWKQR